ncbi:MAG: ATP-binding protein [Lachnospiraceae bacterium]|nr:ATP-binding protein [Lachnospiraceae bacterium]
MPGDETIKKPLPVGIEFFDEIIEKNYYYVDKSLFLKELIDNRPKVGLFLRPRRFGKTLALSMVKCFFEDTRDDAQNAARRKLFDGLKISAAGERYTREMTSYPVISLTLKSAKQPTFEMAMDRIRDIIAREYEHHGYVQDYLIRDSDRERFDNILNLKETGLTTFNASLEFLSECINKATGKKTIILIDEYDVPLDAAYLNGYYDRMIDFIRSLFESGLKTNENLEFAVVTGCLRVSQESIFTGMNNLDVYTLLNTEYSENYGFTQDEVDVMLRYYDIEKRRGDVKNWYDGYRVGKSDVYNPWSAIKCMKSLSADIDTVLQPYWANTSSNDIVRRLVDASNDDMRAEMEALMSGGTIEKPISESVTYRDLESGKDSFWSFMFFTGYLTLVSGRQVGSKALYTLRIPNIEVESIYENSVQSWFDETLKARDLSPLYDALKSGDAEALSEELSAMLLETISYHDYDESFYHGFMAGILKGMPHYTVKSNREAGLGRPDMELRPIRFGDPYIILEFKHTKRRSEAASCMADALAQIASRKYAQAAEADGYDKAICYGIGFWKKQAIAGVAT